jgi:hypothetical protein
LLYSVACSCRTAETCVSHSALSSSKLFWRPSSRLTASADSGSSFLSSLLAGRQHLACKVSSFKFLLVSALSCTVSAREVRFALREGTVLPCSVCGGLIVYRD